MDFIVISIIYTVHSETREHFASCIKYTYSADKTILKCKHTLTLQKVQYVQTICFDENNNKQSITDMEVFAYILHIVI